MRKINDICNYLDRLEDKIASFDFDYFVTSDYSNNEKVCCLIEENLRIKSDIGYKILHLKNCINKLSADLRGKDNKRFSLLRSGFSNSDIKSKVYASFFDSIVGLDFLFPDIGDYIPQDFITYNNYVIVSCYLDREQHKKENSCLFVIDNNGSLLKKIELNDFGNVHVGGITYDSYNNLLWVCDKNATISSFDFSLIIDKSTTKINRKDTFDIGNVGTLTNNASYMTYFNRKIYVGTFNSSKMSHGIVKEISLVDGKFDTNGVREFFVSPQAQAISFVNKDNRIYMALSISFGRKNSSRLEVYIFDDICNSYSYIGDKKNHSNLVGCSIMPVMMEGICLKKIGNKVFIMSLYESFAQYYNSDKNNLPRNLVRYICTNDLIDLL